MELEWVMKMQKIMIVEDDEVIALAIQKHLETWNYEVYVIEDCIAAVNPNDIPASIQAMKEKGAKIITSKDI